ncbi:hypothetical protein DDB_G0270326 [Dictyostelium discoideum AX4]|uniref:Uncharacterized protein n=1 Tax=Dictyostelium discoideum TaxID=44689 RepID=Q55BX1_DICDI|nr:hypothetical protein DDB_G0270326 [Dictyostelium discoideum AX4]EAL72513.1 hypothetical protein DDB_G0270326 [Dictyostelium discoideum AX4]|eukprot:XP_646710.1 hypothetical protein DDB_G0270326 [Dictyostelium discoideum AX4]
MEILFWKVFKNKYLFRLIFDDVKNQSIYSDQRRHMISKRIRFEQIQSLEWLIQKKQYNLLKDKLKSNQPIHITEQSIKRLFQDIKSIEIKSKLGKQIIEILKLLYHHKRDEMNTLDLIETSMIFNSKIALSTFLEIFNNTTDDSEDDDENNNENNNNNNKLSKELFDLGIINSSFECLKFIIENYSINYTESDLIKNALDSNEPDRMLEFIEIELKLDLKELINKYRDRKQSHIKCLSIYFLKSIRYKLLILENNFIIDKGDDGAHSQTISTTSSNFAAIMDGPNKNSFQEQEENSSNLDFNNLKAMLLERFDTTLKRTPIIESMKNVTTTNQLLELHKKHLDLQFISFNVINERVDDEIPTFLKSIFLTRNTLFHLIKLSCMYFNLDALNLYFKVSSSGCDLRFPDAVNVSSFNYNGINKLVQSETKIVEFINKAFEILSEKLLYEKDIFKIIVNVLLIKYDSNVIEAVLNNCLSFSSQFLSFILNDSINGDEVVRLIWKNPTIPIDNLLIVLSRKREPFRERGLSLFISNHTDQDKIKIFNNICKVDRILLKSKGLQPSLTKSYRKKLIEDYLQLNKKSLSNSINIFKQLDLDSIELKDEIISFLFKDFILNSIFNNDNDYDNGQEEEEEEEDKENKIKILNEIFTNISQVCGDGENQIVFSIDLSIIEKITIIFKILKNNFINIEIIKKSIEKGFSDELIIKLFQLSKECNSIIPKDIIFNSLLVDKRYFLVSNLIESFKESNGKIQYFTPSPFSLDPSFRESSLNVDRLFTNLKNKQFLSSKIPLGADWNLTSHNEFLLDFKSSNSIASCFFKRSDIFEHLIEFLDFSRFKSIYSLDHSFDEKIKKSLPSLIKANRLDLLQYYFPFIQFQSSNEVTPLIMLSIQLGNIQILNFFLNYPTFKNSEIQLDFQELFRESLKFCHFNIIKLLISTVSNSNNNKKNSLEINSNQICHLIINNRLEILKYLYKERLLGISDFQDFSLDTRTNSIISRKSLFATRLQKDNYTFFANYLYPIFISPSNIILPEKLFYFILKIKENDCLVFNEKKTKKIIEIRNNKRLEKLIKQKNKMKLT